MERNEVFDKLKETISASNKEIDVSNITEKSDFYQELGLSSIELLFVIFAIEDQFNVRLKNENLENIKTVGELIDLIIAKL